MPQIYSSLSAEGGCDEAALPSAECQSWFGILFVDLDCPHWLPYLTAEKCEQVSPKLTLKAQYVTEWELPTQLPDGMGPDPVALT